MKLVFVISRLQLNKIVMHCIGQSPKEACGLIAGRRNGSTKTTEKIFTCSNTLDSGTRYEIEPRELLRIIEEIEHAGCDLIAIYHSHPTSAARPSQIDLEHAFYPTCSYLIVSLQEHKPEVKSWTLQGERFQEESIQLTD